MHILVSDRRSIQSERFDRAPSADCLSGEYSWEVCRGGQFLCSDVRRGAQTPRKNKKESQDGGLSMPLDITSTAHVQRAMHPPALTRCRRANASVCTRLPQTPIKTHKGTPACGTATAPLVASKASIIPVSRYLAPRSARKMMPRPQKIAWRGDIRGGHAPGANSDAACLSAPPRTFTSDYIRPSRCKGGMHRT